MKNVDTVPVTVDVTVADDGWQDDLDDPDGCATAAVREALHAAAKSGKGEGWTGASEVSVLLADDAAVARLNAAYRGRAGATNVLSFPTGDEPAAAGGRPLLWGDIVLARETVRREAVAQAKTVTDHTRHLLVHGMLHLMGYDHEDDVSAAAMEALEITALAALGVRNPYAESAPGEVSAAGAGSR